MRLFLLTWSLLVLSAAVLAGQPMRFAIDFQLRNGTAVSGEFALRTDGLFHHTASGGRLYDWAEIVPESLPLPIADTVRAHLRDRLRQAEALYAADQIEAAQPWFAYVWARRDYLPAAERTGEAWAEIDAKRQGLVRHDGRWMSFAERQRLLGLIFAEGRWMPLAEARERAAFRLAVDSARQANSRQAAAGFLQEFIDLYPASPHVASVERLRQEYLDGSGLNGVEVAGADGDADRRFQWQPEPLPDADFTSRSPIYMDYRAYGLGSYRDFSLSRSRYWYQHPTPFFIFRDGKLIVSYPGGWSRRGDRHDRGDRHHDRDRHDRGDRHGDR